MEAMRYCRSLLVLLVPALLLAHGTGFPEEALKKVFPEATGYTSRKKDLSAEQLRRVEQLSGSKVQSNDNPLTFYVAVGKTADGSGVLGSVVLVDTRGSKGAMDLAVGIRRDGTVQRVLVVENADDPQLSTEKFLTQLQGKALKSPLTVGQDVQFSGDAKSAEALINAVRRGLLLLEAAAGR